MLLSFVLVIGLMPVPATRAYAEEATGSDDSTAETSVQTSEHDLIAQAEEDGTCASGQALVVYHLSGAAKGTTGDIAVQSDADPLADAGFAPSEVIDLSAADASEKAANADADGALSVQSEATGSAIASGSDVRVALVERDGVPTADLVSQLEALDFVECAGPNYTYQASSLPNDTLLEEQWGLTDTDAGLDYESAYAVDSANTATNVVAILDTGVDYTNPDLEGQMWTDSGTLGLGPFGSHGYDSYNQDYDPMPRATDEANHGTHVAGIAAAEANNEMGVTGVAGANGHTQIMAVAATEPTMEGFSDLCVARAYEYIVRARLAGVNVVAVNDSWGSQHASYDPILDYLVNQAGKAGILSCFAAGNDGAETSTQHKTAALESPYVIEVAANNDDNTLASYSNYDATEVDVSAPGSAIMSTLPCGLGSIYFDALLSKQLGKNLLYYTDISSIGQNTGSQGESALTVTLTDSNGVALTDQSALAVAYGEKSRGEDAVRLTLDPSKLPDGYTASNVRTYFSWTISNPFSGVTDTEPSHYSATANINGTFANPNQFFAVSSYLYGSGEASLSNGTGYISQDREQIQHNGDSSLVSLDTTSPTLTIKVRVNMGSNDDLFSGIRTCLVTGFGIGRVTNPTVDGTSAYVPYGYMTGTSMATPMITGSVAELAAIYPNETALQLRGRICGGTQTLASEADQAKVASGGHFTFASALDDASVNANTWSITTSGTSVTVHGYGLQDALLYVDGSETAVTPTAQTAGSITFSADGALLDGGSHRFDVTDLSSGRTFKASYVTPDKTSSSLVRVRDLPSETAASNAKNVLIASADHLFLADGDAGAWLWSCANPSDATFAWDELAAPGNPWGDNATLNRSGFSYCYANGKIYAFTTDGTAATETETEQAAVYCDEYDIATGTWLGWTKIGQIESGYVVLIRSCAIDGTVYVDVASTKDIKVGSTDTIFSRSMGETTFEEMSLGSQLPGSLHAIGGMIYGLYSSKASDSVYNVSLLKTDPTSIGTSTSTTVTGYGDLDSDSCGSVTSCVKAATGTGIVVAGSAIEGFGDLQLVGTDGTLTSLGSYGLSSASGLTVNSMTMCDGRLYLSAIDHSASTDGARALYSLPTSAAEKLETINMDAWASASSGGTATVADWRGEDSSAISVRQGDTALWTATPDAAHTFAGWYDSEGTLVSTDEHYATPVESDTWLEARFSAKLVTRLWGNGALDTMTAVVGEGGWNEGGTVVLATNAGWWDALSASGVAGLADAPVLLTSPDTLSTQTAYELGLLKPSRIIVCGGTAALPDDVVFSAVSASGSSPTVTRLAGDSATGTAAAIYEGASYATGSSFGTTAIVATSAGYWDALSMAPYAYAKGCPVLLTEADGTLSAKTLSAMRAGGITDAYVIGGTKAIPKSTEDQLSGAGISVLQRVAGAGAIETSLAAAELCHASGMSANRLAVSTSSGWQDALTGAALCGRNDTVLLLASDENLSAVDGFVSAHASEVSRAYVFGGEAAVSAATKTHIEGLLGIA